MRIHPAFLALLAATSCVAPPQSHRPVAAPPAGQTPRLALAASALPADWRDWPLTAGTWRYRPVDGGSAATFGSGSAPIAVLRCAVAPRMVRVIAYGFGAGSALMHASDLARQVPFAAEADAPNAAGTRLAAGDPLLDALAFSRGRWTIEQPGHAPLVLPAYAEVARVVEDCRS